MAGRQRTGKLRWRKSRANHGRKPGKGHIKSDFKRAKLKK